MHSVQDADQGAITKHDPSSEVIKMIGAERGNTAISPAADWLEKISAINTNGFEEGVIGMQMRESEALAALNRLDEGSKAILAEHLPQNLDNNY